MKKSFGFVGIVLSVLVGRGVVAGVSNLFGADVQSILDREVSEISANLPMMIDEETRLDAVSGKNKTLHYKYTLINLQKKELNIAAFSTAMESDLISHLCLGEETKAFRKAKIPMTFTYASKEGEHIADITVQPQQCSDS